MHQRSLVCSVGLLISITLILFSHDVHSQTFVNHKIYQATDCNGSPSLVNSYESGTCQPFEGTFKTFTCDSSTGRYVIKIDTCSDPQCSQCDQSLSTSITNNACGVTKFQFNLPAGYIGIAICGPLLEANNPATFVSPSLNETCSNTQYNSYPIGQCSFSKNFSCAGNTGLKLDVYNASDCSGDIFDTKVLPFDTCLDLGIANSTKVTYSCAHYGEPTTTTTTVSTSSITPSTTSTSSTTSNVNSSSSKLIISSLGMLLFVVVIMIIW